MAYHLRRRPRRLGRRCGAGGQPHQPIFKQTFQDVINKLWAGARLIKFLASDPIADYFEVIGDANHFE